jgi:peptide/nickel transport system ATP-binding protein
MSLGKIVELARKRNMFAAPKHSYTKALLSVVSVHERGAAARASSSRATCRAGQSA